jgi:hypothetical protein
MIIKIPFYKYDLKIRRVSKETSLTPKIEKPFVEINRDYDKIFCIGFGKTGTTSMEYLLQQFGFTLGNQAVAEILSEDWTVHKRTDRIIPFCHTADAFQDAPFGYPGLFAELDKAFPDSKFLLTVRNSSDEWFESLVRFHTKKFSSDPDRPPNEEDLANALYRFKGFMLRQTKNRGYLEGGLYNPVTYKECYQTHNKQVEEYFSQRPNDFLKINVGVKEDFQRLCDFLHVKTNITGFPWKNRTQPPQP